MTVYNLRTNDHLSIVYDEQHEGVQIDGDVNSKDGAVFLLALLTEYAAESLGYSMQEMQNRITAMSIVSNLEYPERTVFDATNIKRRKEK